MLDCSVVLNESFVSLAATYKHPGRLTTLAKEKSLVSLKPPEHTYQPMRRAVTEAAP